VAPRENIYCPHYLKEVFCRRLPRWVTWCERPRRDGRHAAWRPAYQPSHLIEKPLPETRNSAFGDAPKNRDSIYFSPPLGALEGPWPPGKIYTVPIISAGSEQQLHRHRPRHPILPVEHKHSGGARLLPRLVAAQRPSHLRRGYRRDALPGLTRCVGRTACSCRSCWRAVRPLIRRRNCRWRRRPSVADPDPVRVAPRPRPPPASILRSGRNPLRLKEVDGTEHRFRLADVVDLVPAG
jgi:hypothetical protein